jgi:hypothetical protein
MAARYQHLSGEFLAEAVSRLDSIFLPLPVYGEPKQPAVNEFSSKPEAHEEYVST